MSFTTWSGSGRGSLSATYIHHSTIANFADVKLAQKFINAVKQNDIKTLRKVIKSKGFDPNILFRFEGGMEKMSALHYAAKEGQAVVVRELLELGCDANVVTPFDMATPLYMACQHYSQESGRAIVQDLLTYGAEVNRGDHSQRTPLIVASELGNLELVRTLLYYGADINTPYNEDEMPEGMRHSVHSGVLTEREIDEMCDPYRGNNALMQACREHHIDVVEELLSRSCDLHATNKAGNNALHLACKSESRTNYSGCSTRPPVGGHPQIVDLLMIYMCPMDVRNKHLETPLKRAIDGIYEVAVWNISIEDKITETKNFFAIIKRLILAGCDATLCYEGASALQCLLRSDLISKYDSRALDDEPERCIHHLIAAGCPINAKDSERAEKVLPSRNKGQIVKLLREHAQLPPCLKQLARWRVRQLSAKPLANSLPRLGLPTYLYKYVALEVFS